MIPAQVLERINELKRVPRSGWLFAGIRTPESVADHTCATALLAMCLAEAVNREPEAVGMSRSLDVGKVVQLALLHDFAESVLTDLPLRAAQVLSRPVKHAAEAQVMENVFGSENGASAAIPMVIPLWREYRDQLTPEARLVHDADRLDLVYQALTYEQQGQRNLNDYWENLEWHFDLSAQLFAEISALRAELAAG